MTKHGLFLTIEQLELLRELIADYEVFHLNDQEVEEAESIRETLDNLIVEVLDPERYALPDIQLSKEGNSQGYHTC